MSKLKRPPWTPRTRSKKPGARARGRPGVLAAAGALAANIGLGLLATPNCVESVWEAVTSWCEVREAGKDATEAAEAAADVQAEYLICLNDHKRS